MNNEFDDIGALFDEKGFTRDDHFYTIVEGVCSITGDKYQVKFMEVLRKLSPDEIIARCKKMIRIDDRNRMRK